MSDCLGSTYGDGVGMTIRPATQQDLETIRALWEELYAEMPEPEHQQKAWAEVVDAVQRVIQENVALLAEEDGSAVGFALAWPKNERTGYLSDLYVQSAHRRQGIGRELVREAASRLGRNVLTLDVDVRNEGARSLYRLLGFREQSLRLAIDAERLAGAGEEAPSFGSVQVQTDDLDGVVRAVRQFIPRLPGRSEGTVVVPPRSGWTGVYDELCDRQPELLRRLARELSDRMGAVALSIGLERGEVVRFNLFERGRSVDEYLSVPTFYGPVAPGDAVALGANPAVVARLTGADRERIRAVARTAASPAELPPPDELLASIAREMRIEGATYGYREAVDLQGAIPC